MKSALSGLSTGAPKMLQKALPAAFTSAPAGWIVNQLLRIEQA